MVTVGAPGRCNVLGVLNVTPDSFSDGGRWHRSVEVATDHAVRLREAGADLIDVGGESTRPGARRVTRSEELARVLPVLESLRERQIPVSLDTMDSAVAAAGLDRGAVLVNDVSGGLADPNMLPLVAERGVPVVLMHWTGHSVDMDARAQYDDVVRAVIDHLERRCAAAIAAGVRPEQIIIDPGLGFAKSAEHDWALVAQLPRLVGLGFPVLLGASRKRFLSPTSLGPASSASEGLADRDHATAALTALAAHCGVWGVRVHEARSSAVAVRTVQAIGRAGRSGRSGTDAVRGGVRGGASTT